MKYFRKQDVVLRAVAGENLLIPVHSCTESVYTLNSTGVCLWNSIEAPRTEDELAATLVERYRISTATAQADVRAFLDDMTQMGLVVTT
jgi:hypothetical protein